MKVILQKDIFERSRETFNEASQKYGIEFFITEVLDEKSMLNYHKKGINCFVIGAEAYTKKFYEKIVAGSAIIRYGVGYNAVPIDICKNRKIKVGYTPGTLTESVAEHTIALLLSIVRKIPEQHQSVIAGNWLGLPGIELQNKTIAIIGFGSIGQAVARIAKNGFGMKVKVFDKKKIRKMDSVDFFSCNFKEVVQNADVLSLHISLSKETERFINAEKIALMKDGVFFINTARGNLVDEDDLFAALESGKIAGAGLDVFGDEPYKPKQKSDFRKLKNVVLSPHCSSNTIDSNTRMAKMTIENIIAFFSSNHMCLIPEMYDKFN